MRLKLLRYAHLNDFVIGAEVSEEDEVIGFIVCDRNMQRFSGKCFATAAEVIIWAHDNFKLLVKFHEKA